MGPLSNPSWRILNWKFTSESGSSSLFLFRVWRQQHVWREKTVESVEHNSMEHSSGKHGHCQWAYEHSVKSFPINTSSANCSILFVFWQTPWYSNREERERERNCLSRPYLLFFHLSRKKKIGTLSSINTNDDWVSIPERFFHKAWRFHLGGFVMVWPRSVQP